MGLLGLAGGLVGGFFGGPAGAGIGMSLGSQLDGYQAGKETNEANSAQSAEMRAFNAAEAQKNRDFQEKMRSTQYQTTMEDMRKAGLNPMLAYQQGGAGTPTGATASQGSIPVMQNKEIAALTATAQQAQIRNTEANTYKTMQDAKVSEVTAAKVQADTDLSISSATNVRKETERLTAVIEQVKQNVELQAQQTTTEVAKRALMATQNDLLKIQQQLETGKISLVQAQTRMQKAISELSELSIPKAKNTAGVQGSWWMRNISPYLDDAVKGTSAVKNATQALD